MRTPFSSVPEDRRKDAGCQRRRGVRQQIDGKEPVHSGSGFAVGPSRVRVEVEHGGVAVVGALPRIGGAGQDFRARHIGERELVENLIVEGEFVHGLGAGTVGIEAAPCGGKGDVDDFFGVRRLAARREKESDCQDGGKQPFYGLFHKWTSCLAN